MRHILSLSILSILLSSCYVEVTDSHHHSHEPTYSEPFSQLTIDSRLTQAQAVLIAGYSMQLYTLSNQPHQLAFLSNSDNLLNDSVLAQNLIDGDALGVQKDDFNYTNINDACDYGYLNITDYQQRIFDRYTSNNETLDEFSADFSLSTSSVCEINSSALHSPFIIEGQLNYDIFFKNYIANSQSTSTDEIEASIAGNWSVENDNLGYWDIQQFQSDLSYQRFVDNTVWTSFSSNLAIHDHSRRTEGQLVISTSRTLQTELGIIHPYAGEIRIQDAHSSNELELKMYPDSVDIYLNGRILHQFISWDSIINIQSHFDLN